MKRPPSDRADTTATGLDARVRRLAQQRLRALQEDALRGDRTLPAPALDELRALSRMLDVGDRLRDKPPRRRWPPALAFVLTLAVASVFLFVHVRRTEIELDAHVTSASFSLTREQAVTETAVLRSLAAAGFERVDIQGAAPPIQQPTAGRLALTADDAAECRGTLTLDRIILPAGARVELSAGRDARAQLRLQAPGAELRVALEGCVRSGAGEHGAWRGEATRTLLLQLGADEVDLEIAPVPGREMTFTPLIHVGALSLSRVERVTSGDATLVRQISTVLDGTVTLPSLDDAERKLRFGAPLRLSDISGEMRAIELAPGRVHVLLHADVGGMIGGSEAQPRSLMPTLLEWLKANHSLSLLWATALYLLALLTSLQAWWRGSPA